MKLKEIIDLGYTEVVVKTSGYQEPGLFGCWQPFRHIRSIVFKIDSEFMDLYHPTFWISNVKNEDYYIEDDKICLYEPDMFSYRD